MEFVIIGAEFSSGAALLPCDTARERRLGQPIATLGFPGENRPLDEVCVPMASFKNGVISAPRPLEPKGSVDPGNTCTVQHNLDLTAGTSRSPIIDHTGQVIAVNFSGYDVLMINERTGRPTRVNVGDWRFGIHVDEVWALIEHLEQVEESGPVRSGRSAPESPTDRIRLALKTGTGRRRSRGVDPRDCQAPARPGRGVGPDLRSLASARQ